jgi:phospholipase A1
LHKGHKLPLGTKTILCVFIILLTTASAYAAGEDTNTSGNANESAIDRRIRLERATRDNPFVIIPHRPNYGLITYTDDLNEEPFEEFDGQLDKTEVKFQFSAKIQLGRELFGNNGFLYVAYTLQSHWQAFNSQLSSPFRDTNHEPELFLTFLTRQPVLGMTNRVFSIGINHQSNGRGGFQSRSWNRVFAEFVLEKGHFYMSIKPWWRIPEKQKSDPQDATGDDNPDITHYMGYGEITGLYELDDQRLGFMLRNNLNSDNRGAVQLDWSFPIGGRVRGYVQFFNGYGETLIDYNYNSTRFGVGAMIVDWL